MTYEQQTWADDPATTSPLSAARLNHMEEGIAAAANDRVEMSRLTARTPYYVTKALAESDHAAGSWPTARPAVPSGVKVIWEGDTDPGTLAQIGDRWDRVPS